MNQRSAGIILLCVSAFMYGVRYLSASIYMSNSTFWNEDMFKSSLNYVGNGPLYISWIAFAVGVIYLIKAEFGSSVMKFIKDIKDINDKWNEDINKKLNLNDGMGKNSDKDSYKDSDKGFDKDFDKNKNI